MSYDSEQKAAKKARERTASDVEIDLRHVQSIQTDGLTNVAMVFCALTNPPAYDNIWRAVWTQAQENHREAFELLTRCTDAVSIIAVYYPKLQNDVKEALAALQLLTNCIRAITTLIPKPPMVPKWGDLGPEPRWSATHASKATMDGLRAMSDESLRKALDTAADLSIGHAAVLLEYFNRANLYARVEKGLPKLSEDLKGVELVPGIALMLGSVNVTKARLAFAIRYLQARGYWPSNVNKRPKMPKKWMDALGKDYAEINHEELLKLIGVG
jgi:hypothetical protein